MLGVALLLLIISTSSLALETLNSRYFESTAVAFKYSDLRSRQLPETIHALNLPLIFRNQLILSCLGVRPGRDGVLVFQPDTNACQSLDSLRISGLPTKGDSKPVNMGIEPERVQLLTKLKTNALVVIQPQATAVALAGVCICPPVEPLDFIFFDGFEPASF